MATYTVTVVDSFSGTIFFAAGATSVDSDRDMCHQAKVLISRGVVHILFEFVLLHHYLGLVY